MEHRAGAAVAVQSRRSSTTLSSGTRSLLVRSLTIASLTGCSILPGSGPPAAFSDRDPLPDCGSVVVEQGQDAVLPPEVLECMSGPDGGEAVLEAPTDEGDPVRTWYRVGPGIDGVDLFVDTTDDRLGGQEWYRQSCPGAGVEELAVGRPACEEGEAIG